MSHDGRREELQRQRALVAAHLAWLDAELARTGPPLRDAPPPAARPPDPSTPSAATVRAPTAVPLPEPAAGERPVDAARATRLGCWLYFAAALGLAALAAWIIYLAFRPAPPPPGSGEPSDPGAPASARP